MLQNFKNTETYTNLHCFYKNLKFFDISMFLTYMKDSNTERKCHNNFDNLEKSR